MRAIKGFSSFLGIGYIGKGGGTLAALVVCLIWFFVLPAKVSTGIGVSVVLLLSGIAVWAGGKLEPEWGKDSGRIVIDEVIGMAVTLLGFGTTLPRVLLGLILFRFFDIAKPLFIRRMERLPRGWGVVMDDVLAGLYANLILQFLIAVDRI